MIRLLLVDDHASFRQPLALVLEWEADMSVVAQAGTVAAAREALGRLGDGVDLALLDLKLPDGSGAELIEDLHAANPQARALVLTGYSEREQFVRAVEAGAASVLFKTADTQEIADAIRRLHGGEQLIPPGEVIEVMRVAGRRRERDREARLALGRLTPRELEVLQALAEGSCDKEIAERLHLGPGTVRSHMTKILKKLGARSRLQAVVFAQRHGAVKVERPPDE